MGCHCALQGWSLSQSCQHSRLNPLIPVNQRGQRILLRRCPGTAAAGPVMSLAEEAPAETVMTWARAGIKHAREAAGESVEEAAAEEGHERVRLQRWHTSTWGAEVEDGA